MHEGRLFHDSFSVAAERLRESPGCLIGNSVRSLPYFGMVRTILDSIPQSGMALVELRPHRVDNNSLSPSYRWPRPRQHLMTLAKQQVVFCNWCSALAKEYYVKNIG